MNYYKEQLLKKLSNDGWELLEEDDNTDWWLESYWNVKSVKQNYSLAFHVLFLVDPMYVGQNKGSAVWAVGAYKELPSECPLEGSICMMRMMKGKFDEKLGEFVTCVNEYRNETHS